VQVARRGAGPVPGLAELLAGRELEILVLLAAGMPNPRIAAELVVTLDTVKSTSATCWASSARPTAPRPSPAPASSA
jgi:FixJ family two-component response regulator